MGVETPIQESATAQKPVVKNELTQKIDALLPSIKADYQKAKASGATQVTFEEFLQKQLNVKLSQSITVQSIKNPIFKKYAPELQIAQPLPQTQGSGIFKTYNDIVASLTYQNTGYGVNNLVYMRWAQFRLESGGNGIPELLSYDPLPDPFWDVTVYYYETSQWGGGISMYTATYSGTGIIYGFQFLSSYPIQVSISSWNGTTKYLP